jgi:hypothetical protein
MESKMECSVPELRDGGGGSRDTVRECHCHCDIWSMVLCESREVVSSSDGIGRPSSSPHHCYFIVHST